MPKVKTSHGVYDVSDRAAAEVAATQSRPYRTLPASWWDESTAVNMSEWMKLAKEFGWNGG